MERVIGENPEWLAEEAPEAFHLRAEGAGGAGHVADQDRGRQPKKAASTGSGSSSAGAELAMAMGRRLPLAIGCSLARGSGSLGCMPRTA